jgi:uncharacterized protein (DUF1697 family)
MTRYVALLRGINLGRRNVKMDRLREIFGELGCADVATYIASGNVIFSALERDPDRLTRIIETGLREALGYEVAAILRTGPEMMAAAAHEPFPGVPDIAELPLNVAFLREPAPASMRDGMLALRTPEDEFHVHGREIYWLARVGIGRSTAARGFEKVLAGRGTVRNINTVRKIAERYYST